MKRLTTNDSIEEITVKRKKLIDLGLKKGLTNKETIQCSQELDKLLNKYQKINANIKQEIKFINNINKSLSNGK